MTLQYRPSDDALIRHSSATNSSAVGKLMRECCCAADKYVEFTSCGTHIANKYVSRGNGGCSLAQRAYHHSLCKNADDFGSDCCQVGIGDCSSFTGNDKQDPAESYENNCTSGTEVQIGGVHVYNGVTQTQKRHCKSVYMRLEDFKQMKFGKDNSSNSGSTMAQLGWIPASEGGTNWPLAFKIGGHCFVGSPDVRTEAQIKQTTDSSGTTIPACKKIDRSSFNTDCIGDLMVYSEAGAAISAGKMDFHTDSNVTMESLCANCCQAVWVNTTDCDPCPGFANDGTGGGCIEPLEDFAQYVSYEKMAGFLMCDCPNLGTDPTQESLLGLVQGFGGGGSNYNCKETQCQIIGTGGTIADPGNPRGTGPCQAELSLRGLAPCTDQPPPAGIFNNAFFLNGDWRGVNFNCGNPNCADGTANPGPYETCEECQCRTPQCACSCIECGSDGNCDFATCSASYTVQVPAFSVSGDPGTGVGNITVSVGAGSITVKAIRVNSDPTCKANLFRSCANGSTGFDACVVTTNYSCGSVLKAGGAVNLVPDGSLQVQMIVNDVSLVCSLANPGGDGSPCESAAGNKWGVVVGYRLVQVGAGETSGGVSDYTASYVSNSADDDCPPGTYIYCENGTSSPQNGFEDTFNFATSLTVS
jgi:hypothetical protein